MDRCHSGTNHEFTVLFVGDPNLGEEGLEIVRRYFEHVTSVIWKKGDKKGRRAIRALIRSRDWDICVSFYSDLVFAEEDLSHIRLPLNVHPSAPSLPGVGYDTLPLVEGHETYGITLHYMTKKIDDGKIIEVLEKKLPEGLTYTEFRRLTQVLCLKMLEMTAREISNTRNLSEARKLLDAKSDKVTIGWDRRYVSKEQLQDILDRVRKEDPNHPVFR